MYVKDEHTMTANKNIGDFENCFFLNNMRAKIRIVKNKIEPMPWGPKK